MHRKRQLVLLLALVGGCAGEAPQSLGAKQPASSPVVDVGETATPQRASEIVADVRTETGAEPADDSSIPEMASEGDEPEAESTKVDGTAVDHLRALAGSTYRRRVAHFFREAFSCPTLASGTPSSRAAATFDIAVDGTVLSYELEKSGTSAIDAAADAAAKARVGQRIPPAPNSYPDLRPKSFTVKYACM